MATLDGGSLSYKLNEFVSSIMFLSKELIKNKNTSLADKLIKAAFITQENIENVCYSEKIENIYNLLNKSFGSLCAIDYLLKETFKDNSTLHPQISKIDNVKEELVVYLKQYIDKEEPTTNL